MLDYIANFDTSAEQSEALTLKGCIKNCSIIKIYNKVVRQTLHFFFRFRPTIMWDLTDNSKKKMLLLLLSGNFLNDSVQFFSKWGFVHFCIQQMLQKVTEKDHLGKIFRTMEVWHWLVRVDFMKEKRRKFWTLEFQTSNYSNPKFVFQKQKL